MTIQQNAAAKEKKKIGRWEVKQLEFEKISDPISRFLSIESYFFSLLKHNRSVVEADILSYMLETLCFAIYAERDDEANTTKKLLITHAWGIVSQILMIKQGVSAKTSQYVTKVCEYLGLPKVQLRVQAQNNKPLAFKPSVQHQKPGNGLGVSGIEFQLLYGGPFMERSIDSSPDARTPEFEPDRWQREVLDQIDAKESVFIVARTSAGKTFIS